jgi:hypothetical protein
MITLIGSGMWLGFSIPGLDVGSGIVAGLALCFVLYLVFISVRDTRRRQRRRQRELERQGRWGKNA